ncbi:MAG TPA: S-layer homology domain-containing protein [Chloroflexia bacterium]|nr:S-layer homology domain-containing protein [Chloroflexia bacterium]
MEVIAGRSIALKPVISGIIYLCALLLGLAILTSGASAQTHKPQPSKGTPGALLDDLRDLRLPAEADKATKAQVAGGSKLAAEAVPGCSPDWQIWPSANVDKGNSMLSGVSAVSANDVWAVGAYVPAGTDPKFKTLIMHWNGLEWTVVPSPNVGGDDNYLNGVFAYASDDVWAVGYYKDTNANARRTFTVHWNGSNWSTITSPNSAQVGSTNNVLNAVVKSPSGEVWAVGYFDDSFNTKRSLMLKWANSAWSVVMLPHQGTYDNVLQALTVVPGTSGSQVWAAGYYATAANGSTSKSLTMRLNNGAWNIVQGADPGDKTNKLYGLSSTGANDIWAVGSYQDTNGPLRTLALHWTGAAWEEVSSPNSGDAGTGFNAVVSLGADNDWAVGNYYTGPSGEIGHTFTAHWDGSQWSVVDSPTPGTGAYLYSIAAVSPNDIWAVQIYLDGVSLIRTLTLHWNGAAWSVVGSPNGASNENALMDIDAVGPNDVWAVGFYYDSSGGTDQMLSLIEHWDGEKWSTVPSPSPGTNTNTLEAVAMLGANDGWAVGSYSMVGSTDVHTLVMRWNGLTWNVVASPSPNNRASLTDVAITTADKVWFAGSYAIGDDENPLIESWNGSFIAAVPVPHDGDIDEVLSSVSVVPGSNGNDAWAVGRVESAIGNTPFFLHWDGTTWSKIDALQTSHAELLGVSAISGSDVWAAGIRRFASPDENETFTAHWNGSAWSVVASPNTARSTDALLDVAAAGPNDVWAVGLSANADSAYETLAMRWNGSTWNIVPSENTPVIAALYGVTAVSGDDMWAAGTGTDPGLTTVRTLVERYKPCAACELQFNDAPEGSPFYSFVRCLACRDILSGYACGAAGEPCPGTYFRPNDNVTRGQAAKIIANAAGYNDAIPATQQTFADVPSNSPFWLFTERVYAHGAITGYACGGDGEPCDGPGRGSFRPGAKLTRGQLAKITTSVAGYNETPVGESFKDVASDSPFYQYIERAFAHGVISGYACGGPGEPCPGAYFRPGNNVTRGQTAKIVANTFFPNCQTPARPGQ